MAIDDVVSDYDAQIANGSRLSILPLSGDEWLLTHIFVEGAGWELNPHTDSGTCAAGQFGGDTSKSNDLVDLGFHKIKCFLTNGEYVRLLNNTGGTYNGGFSAIKTKE